MKIRVYKTNNCKNCEILIENLKSAIEVIDKKINIDICTSIVEMSQKGIYEIPALEIENEIISQGIVYNKEDLVKILNDINVIKKVGFKNCVVCDKKGCRLNGKK